MHSLQIAEHFRTPIQRTDRNNSDVHTFYLHRPRLAAVSQKGCVLNEGYFVAGRKGQRQKR